MCMCISITGYTIRSLTCRQVGHELTDQPIIVVKVEYEYLGRTDGTALPSDESVVVSTVQNPQLSALVNLCQEADYIRFSFDNKDILHMLDT